MEGAFTALLHTLLRPAAWLAEILGFPDHLPAVELAAGLLFLATCSGLGLLAYYHWLRSRSAVALAGGVIALVGGVLGLLVSIVTLHMWLYLLVLSIIGADVFWRLLHKEQFTKRIRWVATMWAVAVLMVAAGTPTLFLIHSWHAEQRANALLDAALAAERERLVSGTELNRVSASVAALSQSAELGALEPSPGNPQLIALLQRMAVDERLSYLTLLNGGGTVLARTQPASSFGDRWPVDLPGLGSGIANGITSSERGVPLVLAARTVQVGEASGTVLVGGTLLDQNYLTARAADTRYPLFLFGAEGITALAAQDGLALSTLSSSSVDAYLQEKAGKAVGFSTGTNSERFLIRTLPLFNSDGRVITTLGMAYRDSAVTQRLRLDLVIMTTLGLLLLAIPLLGVLRQRKGEAS